MAKKFIDKALGGKSDKGKLHRALDVPEDQPIPKDKLKAAASKKGKVGQEARFAEELEGFGKKKAKK